ncbi:MAG: WhiB family transcriptional regulator, partial [Gemmatimonadota bacterium]
VLWEYAHRWLAGLPDLPRAACRDHDPELWFPRNGDGSKAIAICATCPEKAPCLKWAIEHHARHGIWGGHQFRGSWYGQPLWTGRQRGRRHGATA